MQSPLREHFPILLQGACRGIHDMLKTWNEDEMPSYVFLENCGDIHRNSFAFQRGWRKSLTLNRRFQTSSYWTNPDILLVLLVHFPLPLNLSFNLTPQCIFIFLTLLEKSAASLKTNCFSWSGNCRLPPPLHSPHMHWPLLQPGDAGRAWYANIAWVGGSEGRVCSNVRTLASPTHRSQLLSNHLQRGRRRKEVGPWIQQLLPDRSSQCVNASQPVSQSVREGKCVRVWSLVFVCVYLYVCVSERESARERAEERQPQPLSA